MREPYMLILATLNSEDSDTFNRNRAKISTPKPIKNLYKLFEKCTPEEKYYSAIRLLQGWNDPTIKPTVKLNSMTSEETNETEEDPIDILERNDILLFTMLSEQQNVITFQYVNWVLLCFIIFYTGHAI